MHWFNDMKIGTKLTISNIILGILILTLAGVAIQRLEVIEKNVTELGDLLYAVDSLLQADRDLYQALVAERSMIFSKPGSEQFKKLVSMHKESIQQARDRVERFMTYLHDEKIDQMFAVYESYRDQWEPLTARIRAEREADTRAGRRTAIDLSFGSSAEAFEKMREQIDKMVEYTELYANDSTEQTVASVLKTEATIVTLLLISLAVAITISVVFPKLIVKPINRLIALINELAGGGGDLTKEIRVTSEDEVGQMGHSVNRFIDSLRHLLADIVELGGQFSEQASALNAVSERNNAIADGATSETNMLATSITEMSASVQEVAENAVGAAQQAKNATEESAQGKQVVNSTKLAINNLSDEVQNAANAIDTLKEDATKIDDVVSVIRGIAEQTNLLALNAAIEAARAGEQGRGFAVVADEVRALASRTQASTDEIQDMISVLQSSAQDAFNTMQQGKQSAETAVDQANTAHDSLEKINASIALMADMNTQIAAAAEQQSAVASEISENANKLSMFSSEAAGTATEVKESAGNMSHMAHDLTARLSNFRL